MEKEKLYEILRKHYKWRNGEEDGERADLRCADLRGANLSDVDLSGADLVYANLERANLSNADLLQTDLRGADLENADLSNAVLIDANLKGADLSGADLTGAILENANFRNIILNDETKGLDNEMLNRYFPICCPEYGEFIGWKKVFGALIVKLKITENAKRSSAFGRKCRCSEAVVLAIEHDDGAPSDETEVFSYYDRRFIYRVGETVSVPNFDDDRKKECAPGIHFFITRQEAVDYGA